MDMLAEGIRYCPDYLDRDAQRDLLAAIRIVVSRAPLYRPEMPKTGKPMRVRMTNCGDLGWVTDKEGGYRYQQTHPVTKAPWPAMPTQLLDIWNAVSREKRPPQACLVNFYEEDARMGLHQDRDEKDFSAPVVSISLGDTCRFRFGGTARRDPTRSIRLSSGNVVIMGGPGRLAFHGVDRIYPGTSTLLANGGRINLTLRRVDGAI